MRYRDKTNPEKPPGHQFVQSQMMVAGLQYHRSAARGFVAGKAREIRLVAEPGNRYDSNAIKVIGIYRDLLFHHEKHIGYVPAEVARRLVASGILPLVTPRWRRVSLSDEYVEITFDIIAPIPVAKRYTLLLLPELPPSEYIVRREREQEAPQRVTAESGCLSMVGLVTLFSVWAAAVTDWFLRH